MYKLIVLAAVLAVAAAKPTGLLAVQPSLAYSAPIAYSGHAYAAPIAYSGHAYAAAPAAYAAAPVAYAAAPAAYAVPAAHSYVSGYNVAVHAEPVEQHGYKIVY